mmetsp:Transcript_12982/g.19564  ORF Transcript_12982/g.19564 Transcript_12982/m.19564 type:complete len:110 (-) Transcript_12982:217-546(-)
MPDQNENSVVERKYLPTENEIVNEIIKTRELNPDIGIKSLYRTIRNEKQDWRMNAKAFRKIATTCSEKSTIKNNDSPICDEFLDDSYVVVDVSVGSEKNTDESEYYVVV